MKYSLLLNCSQGDAGSLEIIMKEKNINENKWEAITEQEKKYFEKHCSSINDPVLLILRVHLYAEYLVQNIDTPQI